MNNTRDNYNGALCGGHSYMGRRLAKNIVVESVCVSHAWCMYVPSTH